MIALSEDTRLHRFNEIVKSGKANHDVLIDYWNDFSIFASVEYWIMVLILIAPLIFLFFKIDKSKIFQIGFYGYSFHMLFGYLDMFGRDRGYWNYPFPVMPFLPGLAIDSSFVPVTYMLLYQWTLNRKKNYYLYGILVSGILSFIFKPLLVGIGLFSLYGKIKYFHLFIVYLIVLVAAKFITDVFLWMERKFRNSSREEVRNER